MTPEQYEAIVERLDTVERLSALILEEVKPKPKPIPGVALESTDVRRIYEAWVRAMDKNPKTSKLTPERRQKIQARLKDGYSLDFIVRAIQGCASSEFHMARGQYRGGQRFNDLTLICRNGSMLEKFAAIDAEHQVDDGMAWR